MTDPHEELPVVVVIDDEELLAHSIGRYLEACGWRVQVYCDPVEGLESVLRDPPFVVLIDVLMPSLDGVQLVKHLARSLGDAMPKVLFASACELGPRTLALADGYARKPFRVSEVERELRRWLVLHRASDLGSDVD